MGNELANDKAPAPRSDQLGGGASERSGTVPTSVGPRPGVAAQASAGDPVAAPLDVDAMLSDLDDEPESADPLTTGASFALGAAAPLDVSADSSPPAEERTSSLGVARPAAEPPRAELPSSGAPSSDAPPRLASRPPPPAASSPDPLDDTSPSAPVDLVSQPDPSQSSQPRPSLPPALRGRATQAPPMPVPSLRPPEAAPPPIRASAPPPLSPSQPTFPPLPVPHMTPPPGSTRAGLPEAAPAPSLTRRLSSSHPASPFSPPSGTARTLPGTGPVVLTPTAGRDPMATIPLGMNDVGDFDVPADTADAEPALAAGAPKSSQPKWLWVALAAALVLLVGLLVLLTRSPAPSVLVVSVASPDGSAVPKLSVFVDGETRCSYSPCRIDGLSPGAHTLSAAAPDYIASVEQRLELRPGTDTIHNLVLRALPKTAVLKVSAQGEDVVILVDGKSLGPPPVELADIEPGEHIVRVEGPAFVPLDLTVNLSADETKSVGPLLPKVRHGRLSLQPGAGSEDAVITLDGKPLDAPPLTLQLDGSKEYLLVAEKEGFERFEHTVSFPDGKATLSVDVALSESEGEPEADGLSETGEAEAAKRSATRARATLSMNSIPVSVVLLDGKRLGTTPRIGVSTKPGVHSVTFVHPKLGRKVKRVSIGPGQSKTISVRF